MSPGAEPRPRLAARATTSPGRGSGVRRDLGVALGAVVVVALGAGVGFLVGGSDGARSGTIVGFAACVLAFTLSTVLWTVGSARRFSESQRRRR